MNEIAIQRAATAAGGADGMLAEREPMAPPRRCPRCTSLAMRQVATPRCPAERWQADAESLA